MTERDIRVGCEFRYVAEIDTPAVFQVRPVGTWPTAIRWESWSSKPELPIRGYHDLYGNWCVRTVLPAGPSRFGYQAIVSCPDATEDVDEYAIELTPDVLPDHSLIYTLPSRYVLPDLLADESWSLFGGLPPGYRRVQAICGHVHDYLTFSYGSTSATSTAADVNHGRYGVCRDFTHLAISFCRALNIPARYVFGYLPELDITPRETEMDFAAWMEVWLGDRWWTFDPRNNTRRKGRIVIGRGRDAADVAMATTFGGPELESMTVTATEAPPDGGP
ncbi:MAG TPA: transglutaminase family protein [Pseudonocardia sp.]|jgi:transglutaminase-like putative cysteine protease